MSFEQSSFLFAIAGRFFLKNFYSEAPSFLESGIFLTIFENVQRIAYSILCVFVLEEVPSLRTMAYFCDQFLLEPGMLRCAEVHLVIEGLLFGPTSMTSLSESCLDCSRWNFGNSFVF